MTTVFRHLILAALAVSLSPLGFAADKPSASGKVSKADRHFMMEAAQGGMTEVQLGELAAKNGASDDVKQFGQRMVTDHGKANADLKSLASSMDVTLPQKVSKKQQKDIDKMSKLEGAAFDREYAKNMVKDHEKDVAAFRKQAAKANSSEVKEFAGTTLPTLEEHLKMARAMKDATGKTVALAGRARGIQACLRRQCDAAVGPLPIRKSIRFVLPNEPSAASFMALRVRRLPWMIQNWTEHTSGANGRAPATCKSHPAECALLVRSAVIYF